MFELSLCVDYSPFIVTRAGLSSRFVVPDVSWEVESYQERAQVFQGVILDGEAESRDTV
jgi:hypothetical protein